MNVKVKHNRCGAELLSLMKHLRLLAFIAAHMTDFYNHTSKEAETLLKQNMIVSFMTFK